MLNNHTYYVAWNVGEVYGRYNRFIGQYQSTWQVVFPNSFIYQGEEAAGAGNPPTAGNWHMGDMVKNTDDNTIWLKDYGGTMRKIRWV